MMFMVMLVLDNADLLDKVLDAWDKDGICGATIIESSGFHRRRNRGVLLPLRYNLPEMEGAITPYHYTLFVIVPKEENAMHALQVAENITGDLSNPNTGIFAVWPLTFVKGFAENPAA